MKPHDHHNKNEFAHGGARDLQPQVLLIDAGCEWECYASDSAFFIHRLHIDFDHRCVMAVTRTMPVGNGGKFTPEAKAIYELVLEMQKVATRLSI